MENLIKLQRSYEISLDLKKRIDYLRIYPKRIELKEKANKIKRMESGIKEKLDYCRTELKIQEKELNYQEELIKEIVNELYSGKINDIKVLGNLKEKEEKINSKKEIIENEVIDIMGKIDIYTREINKIKHRYNLLEEHLEKLEIQLEEKIIDYDKKLLSINKKIEDIRKNMNMETLKRYDEIRKRYDNAVVKVVDETCSGCNLQIFLNTVNLISKKELAECEHCGRLVYIE